ncbi:MAG: RdgB/HAM1 family non-canonical purine NTP pyrophosphatase [Rhabdochlamydiaceae bacterium]|jgi:XTP/dITP diphosphohydrolase
MELVVASKNIHKIRELRSMLKEYKQFDVLSLLDFPAYTPPEEDGSSFEEIASNKALHAAKALNRWTLADDSGLIVPALQGAPGIYSSRYAGDLATDAENRHKLLKEMEHILDPQRQGYFECWIVIASPEGIKKCVKGLCEGMILGAEKGSYGFGYDSIFIKHEYGKSFAEIEENLKNRISHRRKAFDKLHVFLSSLGV